MKDDSHTCTYMIEDDTSETKIIVECGECSNSFSFRSCLPEIVRSWDKVSNSDKLIFSDTFERKYSKGTVEIISFFLSLHEQFKRNSRRDPDKKECKKCVISPKRIYSSLIVDLEKDPEDMFESINSAALELMKSSGCRSCRRATIEELRVLSSSLLDMNSRVLSKAYGIVGEG